MKKITFVIMVFIMIFVLPGCYCSKQIKIGKRKIVGNLKLVQINSKWNVEGLEDENVREEVIPDGLGIEGIYEKAFGECKKLKKVTINACIKRIYKQAFQHCVSLRSITLPNSLETI